MSETLFQKLKAKFDHSDAVELLLSSKDPELQRYLDFVGAIGSTDMDENGRVAIKIHDAAGASKGCWLEEFGHALQFLRDGNVPLSREAPERRAREIEVANCLLHRVARGRLDSSEASHAKQALAFYGAR